MTNQMPFYLAKCGFIFCLLFFCINNPAGAYAGKGNYETPPPNTNSIQWEAAQRQAKERQESYRKRIVIPSGVSGSSVPQDMSLNADSHNPFKPKAYVAPPAPISPEVYQNLLFIFVVLLMAGVYLARKYAPQVLDDVNRRYNPLARETEPDRSLPDNLRAEDEAFDKFLTTFRVGPTVPAVTETAAPEKDKAVDFHALAVTLLASQRLLLQDIVRESGLARQKLLSDLRASMYLLADAADFPDALPVWQVATALEGLLKQLTDKMGNVTSSALRTVVGGVELLDDLCATGLQPQLLTDRELKFLVVDDEMISRHALSFALGKAFTKPDVVENAETALARIGEQAYDVIFLDVQMPGMDGFELCVKIHESILNRNTPVVFVTGRDDFNARARSTISGGNDLIAKPFLTFEVTIKALTLALRGRLHGRAPDLERSRELLDPLLGTSAETVPPVTVFGAAPRTATTAGSEELTNAFLTRALKHIEPLREICRQMVSATNDEERQALLADGFLRINSMITKADEDIIHPAYKMITALEGLFRKLLESSKHSSASTLATLTSAVDVLHDLCAPGLKPNFASHPPIDLLVVEDDLFARRAIVGALQTAFNRPESVEGGEAALVLAADRAFDLIFLDVIMPGMNGYEVCTKIRNTIPNRSTPVVFVTGQNDDDAHEQMNRSGGSDFLGKPFLTSEITVKALTYALRGRLQRIKTPA